MALMTKSKFYYGPDIDLDFNVIDFSEAVPELNATIPVKLYSPSELASTVQDAMNNAGGLTYSVVFNRTTRLFTISGSGTFTLKIATGTHTGSNVWDKMGFTGAIDLSGTTTYTGDTAVGSVYTPQFYLLDYVPLDNWQEAVDASINVTGSGRVEVIRYGTQKFTQFSIELINDYKFLGDIVFESDTSGVANTNLFMQAATRKAVIEFIPDRLDDANYQLLILESTDQNRNGIGYRLSEMLDRGAGYYKTGLLVWREYTE
jgi:hypothetical protein